MKLLGLGAAAAIAVQTLLLTWPNLQGPIAAAALAALVFELWTIRRHLNQHTDMLLLMTSYGGLGMLLGGPACHLTALAFVGMFALGLPTTLYGSRCLRAAHQQHRLLPTIAADILGMFGGMWLGHVCISGHNPMLHHVSMLAGMLLGMLGLQLLLQVLRERRVTNTPPALVSR